MRPSRLGITPSTWHPVLYRASVWQKRMARSIAWHFDEQRLYVNRAKVLYPLPSGCGSSASGRSRRK